MVVRLDPAARTLDAQDVISLDAPRALTLVLSGRFKLKTLEVDGRRVQPAVRASGGVQRIAVPAGKRIALSWSGALAALDAAMDHRDTLGYAEPASGAAGAFLPAGSRWYPASERELERYRVALRLPSGQRALAPGRLVEERDTAEGYQARFEFQAPAEGISVMAGPYRIDERRVRTAAGTEVRLRTYFHDEIAALSGAYLDAVSSYLDLYEPWIGPYPFTEFSVVSSPTPTGFGMPTLTYLGIQVLRLPFIRATSLGHEVLHNWWGNGVYPDVALGNWSESLTTFMADYFYRERAGEEAARAMRLTWLREYAAMPPDQDRALERFTSRSHGASQIVGYHKGAMVFFMLRELIGAPSFDAGLQRFWREQRFRVASWDDLRRAFEISSGRSLKGFFDQWLARPGAPQLRIAGASAVAAGPSWRVRFELDQGATPFALAVPLVVRGVSEALERRVELSRERQGFELEVPFRPQALVLDPEQRVFRKLLPDEAPPILREVMLSQDAELITPGADEAMRAAAQKLAARLLERAPRTRSGDEPPRAAATLLVARAADVDRWLREHRLPPRPAALAPDRGSAQVWTARLPGSRTLAVVSALDAQALAALASPLPHYGQQSYLVFDGARAIENGVWPAQPQTWPLAASR
jgi:aminopeptidase N